jgi:hypothetical protein
MKNLALLFFSTTLLSFANSNGSNNKINFDETYYYFCTRFVGRWIILE